MIINKKLGKQHSERNLTMPRASASRENNVRRGICFALSNREPTMPPASDSRASSATREICFVLSNREPDLLERGLSHCKQTKATVSNREPSTIYNPSIPRKKNPQNSKNPANIYKWSRPLLTGTASQIEFHVTYRKQSAEKFLTGARTPFGIFAAQPLIHPKEDECPNRK